MSKVVQELIDRAEGAAKTGGVHWSESFVVLKADTPLEKIKTSLRSAKYAVLIKDDQHLVVKRDELELAYRELGLRASRRHVVFRHFEGHRRGRNPRVESLREFGLVGETFEVIVDTSTPWAARMVKLDSKGQVTAVGDRVQKFSAAGQTFLKPAKERFHPQKRGALKSPGGERLHRASASPPEEPSGPLFPGLDEAANPEFDEATDIVRHPAIEPRGPAVPGQLLQVEVDLLRDLDDPQTESEGVRIPGLPVDWKWIDVDVKLHSPDLVFEQGDGEGRIRVRRNQASTPHVF
ncbi:MAG TPA: hypothetical protein VM890_04850, partial [Longimicrobium sp.]|nr:hypothetical protein [Longimicrobium sp.]